MISPTDQSSLHHHVAIQPCPRLPLELLAAKSGTCGIECGTYSRNGFALFRRMKSTACSVYHCVSIGWCSAVTRSILIFPFSQNCSGNCSNARDAGVNLPHIVRVHQPARFVEAPRRRTRLRLVADVPLPEHRGLVARALEHLAHRGELRVEPPRPRRVRPEHLRPPGIASAHQRRPRRRAHRLRHVEVREPASLRRQPLHIRRRILRPPERPEVGIPRIVEEDDDDVRRPVRLRQRCRSHTGGKETSAGRIHRHQNTSARHVKIHP